MTKLFSLISDYLLASIISSFILGIGLSCQTEISPSLLYSLIAISCSAVIVCHGYRRANPTLLSLMATFFLLGLAHGSFSSRPPENPSHIFNLIKDKQEIVAVGTLAAMVSFDGKDSQARIDLESVRFPEHPAGQTAIGTIVLRLKAAWPDDILPGTKLAIRAVLQRPAGSRTPGCFDYPAHLARQDIWVTGHIQTPAFLHRIESPSSLLHTLRYLPEYLRHHIAINIDEAVPQPLQGIYRALLIGDQAKVDEKTRDTFRDSGCMHILSISGLHFAIIGSLLYLLVYWLLRRSEWLILHYNVKKIALFTCLPPLCFYALLAGMNAPVLRSLIMSCTAILALCVDRRKSIPTLLAFAALLILLANPQSLFNISFQLSFAAIAAISAVSPILSLVFNNSKTTNPSVLQRLRKWLFTGLLISIAATLGTAPLLLANFNQISLIGPLANLIVEPLLCLWSLPLALLSCLAMPFSPDFATVLLRLGAPGLELSLSSMELLNSLPLSSIWLASPHPLLTTVYYFVLIVLIWSLHQRRKISAALLTISCGVLFLFFVTPAELTKNLKKDLTVTFLDVGQGNSTLLEYPGGYRILIDGGSSITSARKIGESIIAPFLWQKGITSIDQIVITHSDADHYNGIPFILKHFKPTLLWTNSLTGHDRPFDSCIGKAKQQGVNVVVPKDGQDSPLQDKAGIRCLANLGQEGVHKKGPETQQSNDRGLLVQGSFKDFSVLFPGDISSAAEKDLIGRIDDVASTILLSPHHGSKTSNSQAFLATVQPRYLIVSAGYGRSKYFPDPGLAEQCLRHDITMLTTAQNGTIEVTTDGERFDVVRYSRAATGPLPSRLVAERIVENMAVQPSPLAVY